MRLGKVFGCVMSVCSLFVMSAGLASCTSSEANGTYYRYTNGSYDHDDFYTLKNGKWTDNDGESGKYDLDGINITIHFELFGEEDQFTGTVENGVLTIDVLGVKSVYCTEGTTPSN